MLSFWKIGKPCGLAMHHRICHSFAVCVSVSAIWSHSSPSLMLSTTFEKVPPSSTSSSEWLPSSSRIEQYREGMIWKRTGVKRTQYKNYRVRGNSSSPDTDKKYSIKAYQMSLSFFYVLFIRLLSYPEDMCNILTLERKRCSVIIPVRYETARYYS